MGPTGWHVGPTAKTTVKTSQGVICPVLKIEEGSIPDIAVHGANLDSLTTSGVKWTSSSKKSLIKRPQPMPTERVLVLVAISGFPPVP